MGETHGEQCYHFTLKVQIRVLAEHAQGNQSIKSFVDRVELRWRKKPSGPARPSCYKPPRLMSKNEDRKLATTAWMETLE